MKRNKACNGFPHPENKRLAAESRKLAGLSQSAADRRGCGVPALHFYVIFSPHPHPTLPRALFVIVWLPESAIVPYHYDCSGFSFGFLLVFVLFSSFFSSYFVSFESTEPRTQLYWLLPRSCARPSCAGGESFPVFFSLMRPALCGCVLFSCDLRRTPCVAKNRGARSRYREPATRCTCHAVQWPASVAEHSQHRLPVWHGDRCNSKRWRHAIKVISFALLWLYFSPSRRIRSTPQHRVFTFRRAASQKKSAVAMMLKKQSISLSLCVIFWSADAGAVFNEQPNRCYSLRHSWMVKINQFDTLEVKTTSKHWINRQHQKEQKGKGIANYSIVWRQNDGLNPQNNELQFMISLFTHTHQQRLVDGSSGKIYFHSSLCSIVHA